MWNSVSKILLKKINKKGRQSCLLSSRVCYIALTTGEGLFRPIFFKNGTLLVETKDSSSASVISLSSNSIRKKINQELGQEIVKTIKIRINK